MKTIKALTTISFVLVLLLFTAAASSSYAQGKTPLSLETALLFALNNNPDINIVQEQMNQSGFAIKEAQAAYYPQVDFTGSAGIEHNDPSNSSDANQGIGTADTVDSHEFNFTVNQLLFDGFGTPEEVRRRKQLLESSSFQSEVVQEEIILDTTQAYLSVYRFQRTLAEAQIFISQLEKISDKVDLMVRAGAENLARSKFAKSRLSNAKSETTNAKASLANAIADLEFLTGKLPLFEAKLPEIQDVLSVDLEEYVNVARKDNTGLLLNQSDRQALQHELGTVKARYMPSFNVLLEYSESEDIGGEIGSETGAAALLQMSYSIFDGFARDAATKRVKSQINEIEYQEDRIERDIRQQLQEAYNQILSLEEEYIIVEEEAKTNKELQELTREQFELGEGDIINLIEGEERLFSARIRQHQIESDIVLNAIRLIRQIGHLDKNRLCSNC